MCVRCGGMCGELLGVTPPTDALRGFSISIWSLCDQLSTPAPDACEVTLKRSAPGFILALMGSYFFEDNKGMSGFCGWQHLPIVVEKKIPTKTHPRTPCSIKSGSTTKRRV